jgi:integrase
MEDAVKGRVFKRCGCTEVVLNAGGARVLDKGGKPKRRQLGASCPQPSEGRHGAWWYQHDLPRGPDGKRREAKVGPFRTKRAAESELADSIAKTGRGEPAGYDRRQTVGAYLDTWLAGKRRLKPMTARSYATHIRLYLKPGIGHIRLVDLRDDHISELYVAMRKIGREPDSHARLDPQFRRLLEARTDTRQSRRPLSDARIRRVHATLMSALNAAVKRKRMGANPAFFVELPSGKSPKALVWTAERVEQWRRTGKRPSPVMVWTPEQVGAFLDFVAYDRLYPLFHLVAYRGLRRGEVCALAWVDVDLDAAAISVRQSVSDPGDGVLDTKTHEDHQVSLDVVTVAVLRAWRRRQTAERLQWGNEWIDSGRVFTRENGEPLDPDTVSQRFDRLVERTSRPESARCAATIRSGERCRRSAPDGDRCPVHGGAKAEQAAARCRSGLPPIRFHDLRHCAASLALAAKVDMKVVSEQLGHSSEQITRDIYTSVIPQLQQAAAEAVASIVPRLVPGESDGEDGPDGGDPSAMRPHRDHTGTNRTRRGSGKPGKRAGQRGWGGWDSNPRPRDYEHFRPERCADLQRRRSAWSARPGVLVCIRLPLRIKSRDPDHTKSRQDRCERGPYPRPQIAPSLAARIALRPSLTRVEKKRIGRVVPID